MSAKKKKATKVTTKSNTKSSKKNSSLNWLIGIGIVVLVAIVGIVIVNISNAATVSQYKAGIYSITNTIGEKTYGINITGKGTYNRVGKFESGAIKWKKDGYCYTIANTYDEPYKNQTNRVGTLQEVYYQGQQIVVSRKSSCDL